MAELFDSHCHLTYDGLRERIDNVVDRAAAVGVARLVTIATDLADAERAFALAARFSAIRVAAGIHPHEATKALPGWDVRLRDIVARPDVVAVGETGLDYHYDFSDRASQQRVFRRQLELACETAKPVVIHCREAHADTLAALADYPALTRVVFHCFTGSTSEADAILTRGYWISLTGVVTFKKSNELRDVARLLPADRFMIETDAPYLSPEPFRNVRPNEPCHLVHTAACIARARGESPADLAARTTRNACTFFGIG